MKITTSPFIYRGEVISARQKMGNLQNAPFRHSCLEKGIFQRISLQACGTPAEAKSPRQSSDPPLYFHGRGSVPAARKPAVHKPQPETPQNAKIKLSAKTTQYRNRISTLLGVSPLKFHRQSTTHHIMSRTPLPLLHKHTNRYKGVYLARCRIL